MSQAHRSSRHTAPSSLALACLLLVTSVPPAAAQEVPAGDAAALKQQGNEAMAQLRPSDALVAYKKAYELSKEPALLYNMGHAEEAIGDYPAALAEYEEFARVAPPELKARVPRLTELIADIRGRVTKVTLRCNVPGARVLVRDVAVGQVGPDKTFAMAFAAGPAKLEVLADGYAPHREQTTFERGATSTFDVDLVPKAAAGVLSIATTPVSGTVLIDGKLIGQAPVEDTVPAGTHRIVVRHEGYPDTETQAVAEIGQTKQITIPLEKGASVLTKWWFWTGVGVVAVGGAVLTYALLKERSPDSGSIAPRQGAVPLARF